MKIALLHYAAPPVVGGVESVIGWHARLMTDAGHEVRILAGRGEQTDERIQFVPMPLADSLHPEVLAVKKELDQGNIPAAFEPLVERLAADLELCLQGTDWLIAHNVGSLNKNLPLTAAVHRLSTRQARPKIALWHHDLAWTTPRYAGELHEGYPWDLLKTAWPGVEQVTISQFRRAELATLMQIPEESIRVIPNGVDLAAFLRLERWTRDIVERLHLSEAAPLLLLPVRITPRKNIELALRTLAQLRSVFPNALLVVTGPLGAHNPANRDYFEKLAALRRELGLEHAAHFLAEHTVGPLPDEVISDFYRLADALLLPSREEGFGIPILEAGLAGIPVFCSDIPPLRELGAGFADYFPAAGGPADIAGLIARRLETDAAFRLRERVRSQYLWERVYRTRIVPFLEKG
ncbi:MAG TPA: glycosyltransferase family 4 protein [Anaerolineales bacterium]